MTEQLWRPDRKEVEGPRQLRTRTQIKNRCFPAPPVSEGEPEAFRATLAAEGGKQSPLRGRNPSPEPEGSVHQVTTAAAGRGCVDTKSATQELLFMCLAVTLDLAVPWRFLSLPFEALAQRDLPQPRCCCSGPAPADAPRSRWFLPRALLISSAAQITFLT